MTNHDTGRVSAIVADNRDRFGDGRIQFAPDIDAKKLAHACEAYGPDIAPEDVLALVDTTMLGGAKDGVLITESALHLHEAFQQPIRLPLDQITSLDLDKNTLVVNGSQRLNVVSVSEPAALINLLRAITPRTPDPSWTAESGSVLGEIMPCVLCWELRPVARTHTVYTAIKWTSRAHTEQFKTWATVQKTFRFQRHTFAVCEACCRRNRMKNWLLFAAAAVIAAWATVQWLVFGNLTGLQFLWPLGLAAVGAFVLSARFADTEGAALREAKKERALGAEAEIQGLAPLQPQYRGADVTVEAVGYLEPEFTRVQRKLESEQSRR